MVISPGLLSPVASQQPLVGSNQIPTLPGINTPLPGGVFGATLLPGSSASGLQSNLQGVPSQFSPVPTGFPQSGFSQAGFPQAGIPTGFQQPGFTNSSLNFMGLNSALSQSQPFVFDPSFLQSLGAPTFSTQSQLIPGQQFIPQQQFVDPSLFAAGQVPQQLLPQQVLPQQFIPQQGQISPSALQGGLPFDPSLLLRLAQQQPQVVLVPVPTTAKTKKGKKDDDDDDDNKGPGKKQKTLLPPGLANKDVQRLPISNPFRALLGAVQQSNGRNGSGGGGRGKD